MYNSPFSSGTGVATGVASATALAYTGASTFAYVTLAVGLVLAGLLALRAARTRRHQTDSSAR